MIINFSGNDYIGNKDVITVMHICTLTIFLTLFHLLNITKFRGNSVPTTSIIFYNLEN